MLHKFWKKILTTSSYYNNPHLYKCKYSNAHLYEFQYACTAIMQLLTYIIFSMSLFLHEWVLWSGMCALLYWLSFLPWLCLSIWSSARILTSLHISARSNVRVMQDELAVTFWVWFLVVNFLIRRQHRDVILSLQHALLFVLTGEEILLLLFDWWMLRFLLVETGVTELPVKKGLPLLLPDVLLWELCVIKKYSDESINDSKIYLYSTFQGLRHKKFRNPTCFKQQKKQIERKAAMQKCEAWTSFRAASGRLYLFECSSKKISF